MSKNASAGPVRSMTGFARGEGQADPMRWAWEIRGVNGRGLDIRLRLPPGCERLDPIIRKKVNARLARGSISISLELRRSAGAQGAAIDAALLETLAAACRERGEEPRYDRLLRVRGVVGAETDRADTALSDDLSGALEAGFETALTDFVASRDQEGAALESTMRGHLQTIEDLAGAARRLDAAQPDAIRARLSEQIGGLLPDGTPLNPERFEQEVALMAVKADTREELDRLDAHISAARDLLDGGGPIGRKLDFLSQEFNREANTLCSKSTDVELTRVGLDFKAAVDQLKEQAANIE